MFDAADSWKKSVQDFFHRHPEREFMLIALPVSALQGVARAGWIAGAASVADSTQAFQPVVFPGDTAIMCIVRRSNKESGRPLPGVFLLDGAPSTPPKGGTARNEEHFCSRLWALAQAASAAGGFAQ